MIHGGQVGRVFAFPGVELLRDDGRDWETLLGCGDGTFEALCKREFSKALAQQAPSTHTTRHAPGKRRSPRNGRETEFARFLQVPRVGRTTARIESIKALILFHPENREEITTDTVARRFRQAQHRIRRDGRIHTIATGLQNIDTRHGGKGLAGTDHTVPCDDGRPVTVTCVQARRIDTRTRAIGLAFSPG